MNTKLLMDPITGSPVYPITGLDCVLDNDGRNLSVLLKSISNKVEVNRIEVTSVTPSINTAAFEKDTYIICTTPLTSLTITTMDHDFDVFVRFSVSSNVSNYLPITLKGGKITGASANFNAAKGTSYILRVRNALCTMSRVY